MPVSADPDAADRLVVVQVRCEAPAGAAPVSPYDLAPAERVRGTIGFLVPRSAQGLVLHVDAQVGDDTAEVPLG